MELFIGETEEFFVRNQVTGSDAQDDAATREVIEKGHTLGDMEGVVKRKTNHRGAETDTVSVGSRLGEGHFRCRHGLPTTGVMLANEKLVEVQRVRVVNQQDVTIERQRRILGWQMKWHHKE